MNGGVAGVYCIVCAGVLSGPLAGAREQHHGDTHRRVEDHQDVQVGVSAVCFVSNYNHA